MTPVTDERGWERVAFLVLDGTRPRPKARARVTRNGTYTPERTTAFENAVAWRARAAMGARKPTTAPVSLVCRFEQRTRIRSDLDNLVKSVSDALNGVVWADDSQVIDLRAAVTRGAARDCTTVAVFEIPPTTERTAP